MKPIKLLSFIFIFFFCISITQGQDDVGTITIKYKNPASTAKPTDSIRITAKDAGGHTIDKTVGVNGLTQAGAVGLISTLLTQSGWTSSINPGQDNNIMVFGHGTDKITSIDGGDNTTDIELVPDGHAKWSSVLPGDKRWHFVCYDPPAGLLGGVIMCSLNAVDVMATILPGETPVQVATKLEDALTAAGVVVTRIGADITMDWADPVNAALFPNHLDVSIGIDDSDGGPHLQIVFPPWKNNIIPTLTQWGLIILGAGLLAIGSVYLYRRKRIGMSV
jgi:hypothetical protein